MSTKSKRQRYKRRREDILSLRRQGLSFRAIRKELGCSKATISYHCGANQSEKKRVAKTNKEMPPLCKKVGMFKAKCSKEAYRNFRNKIKGFKKKRPSSGKKTRARSHWRVHNIGEPYDCKDVIDKIGVKPRCYLTGRKIDLNNSQAYSLDHRVPTAKGGSNSLNNLEVSCTEANRAKADLTLNDFYKLCEEILAWRDKQAKRTKRVRRPKKGHLFR